MAGEAQACPCEGERQRALEQRRRAGETGEDSTRGSDGERQARYTQVTAQGRDWTPGPSPAGLPRGRSREAGPGLSPRPGVGGRHAPRGPLLLLAPGGEFGAQS